MTDREMLYLSLKAFEAIQDETSAARMLLMMDARAWNSHSQLTLAKEMTDRLKVHLGAN